jgi:hypothetical protein
MDRWPGDILHAPALGGRPVYLHAFLDDHSRLSGYPDKRDYPEDGIMPIRRTRPLRCEGVMVDGDRHKSGYEPRHDLPAAVSGR